MRKLAFGATFLLTTLVVRAAVAGVALGRYIAGSLVVILFLALVCFLLMLPALLLSSALRKYFNQSDDDLDEPYRRISVLSDALGSTQPAMGSEPRAKLRG